MVSWSVLMAAVGGTSAHAGASSVPASTAVGGGRTAPVATCAGYPSRLGREELDAQTWADWGVDYLK